MKLYGKKRETKGEPPSPVLAWIDLILGLYAWIALLLFFIGIVLVGVEKAFYRAFGDFPEDLLYSVGISSKTFHVVLSFVTIVLGLVYLSRFLLFVQKWQLEKQRMQFHGRIRDILYPDPRDLVDLINECKVTGDLVSRQKLEKKLQERRAELEEEKKEEE